jgi:hypothetical protein
MTTRCTLEVSLMALGITRSRLYTWYTDMLFSFRKRVQIGLRVVTGLFNAMREQFNRTRVFTTRRSVISILLRASKIIQPCQSISLPPTPVFRTPSSSRME